MEKDIGKVLIAEQQIKEKVKELGQRITKDYEGKSLILIGLLKGSVCFMADLMREINLPLYTDYMVASSYGNDTVSSGIVNIKKDVSADIRGMHVIIVEDIIDSGRTLHYMAEYLKSKKCSSVEICSLLSKPSRREIEVDAKYIGFEIPDEFVVGYGLDYAEKYRNLPYIGVLKPSVYSKNP
ncbi:MAG: hypoxanthine phosphoribosyltransferase [Ruminococcaceae bacterium]|nr:hypoxanthine phosphoribosyltransferase [Oscillospiraceae bacterium]